ncbi:anthrax toxin-like adenylyl cyclase domain-containing protein [Pandoraea sp. NPDC090278]|uniref:anthrax toxin-like adenylyl cyclase domain-containing protein n=1 Tax=Pandoraea sp. NPDC090278 TaxID=3364391 RepID=UPI00383A393F
METDVVDWTAPTTGTNEACAHLRLGASTLLFAESIQRVANRYNVVIGLRRPSAHGQSLLREGFPSKNFHVKAKSSGSGPTAGFVPIEPKYSKVGVAQWDKQARAVASSLQAGARAVDLRLTSVRVAELIELGAMTHVGGTTYRARYPAGEMNFSLRRSTQNSLSVFDDAGRPVTVMTNPPELPGGFARDKALKASALPITADYDLFCIFSRWQRDIDLPPMPVQPRILVGPKNPASHRAFQYLRSISEGASEPEDPNMGNIPLFHRTIVDALNTAVASDGYTGGKLFWHNPENGNPFSPGFSSSDAPLFFVPGAEPLSASSLDGLRHVMDTLRSMGYAAKLSPRLSVEAPT